MRDWRAEILRGLEAAGLDPATEAEVVEELAQHLEDRYAELVGRGMDPAEARSAALAELDTGLEDLGGRRAVVLRQSSSRAEPAGLDATGFAAGVGADLRYALRSLGRSPGYAAVVVLTLGLGIGAASVAQAVIDPLLLRPLGFAEPSRLVTLDSGMIPGEYEIIRRHTTAFEQLSLVRGTTFGVAGDGEPERIGGALVTPEYFATLGVRPVLGAVPAEGEAGEWLMLSHALWQRRYGGDAAVIGRAVRIDGRPVVIVGVMPPGFDYPSRAEAWLAAPLDATDMTALWGSGGYRLVGRLLGTVAPADAESQVRGLAATMSAANPFWTPDPAYRAQVRVLTLHEALVGDVRRSLLLLGGAVALLLLIACSNVANLVLARGLGRARELAVRTALGASGTRIVRQLLTETLLLATIGGAVGVAFAFQAVGALRAVLPPELPRTAEIGVDLRVLAASILITFATGLLLGVLPARRATRFDLQASLRDGTRAIGDRVGHRLSDSLAVAQVALALMLVTGAWLVSGSLLALQRTETGMARMEVMTARLDLPKAQYVEPTRRAAFFDDLLSRIAAVPGVHTAALTSQLPFSGHLELSAMAVEHVTTDPNDLPMFVHRRVTPRLFDALGIPLRAGRSFTAADASPDAAPVALIDEAAAREFWPGEDPIGRRLGRPWLKEQLVVIGVVGSVLDGELAGEPERTVYTPLAQEPPHSVFIVLHTAPGASVLPALRRTLRDLDASVPISDVGTVASLIAGTLTAQRLSALLLTGFSAVALFLAAIGIYGVLAHGVTRRTRELSLRIALGAGRLRVLGMVLRDGMLLVAAGTGIGVAGALASARLLRGILFGVEPHDPLTLAGVILVVLLAAVAAVLAPAIRASRCEPMLVLRE